MTLSDVVPATVPLDPVEETSVTVPADTHLLYFCRIAPMVPAAGLPDYEYRSIRSRLFRELLDTCSAKLTVGGTRVGLVEVVVRPAGDTELGYWNIEEPLPTGSHTATLTLTAESESNATLPPCVAHPSQKPIPETEGDVLVTDVTIYVVDKSPNEFPTATDPFWDRRDVREGIVNDECIPE